MSKVTITSEQLSGLLKSSLEVVTSKLTPEELASLSEDMAEVNSRLDAQTQANTAMKNDLDAEKVTVANLTTEKNTLTTENANLTTEKADLTQKVTTLEAEVNTLKPYKTQIELIQGGGRQLPKTDSNSSAEQKVLPDNHPDAIARKLYRQAHNLD